MHTTDTIPPPSIIFPLPLGTIIAYSGNIDDESRHVLADTGWLVCDGKEVNRSTYRALYLVIGEIHGHGDGINTFNLPDYRGYFLRGVDAGAGRDPDATSRKSTRPGVNPVAQSDRFSLMRFDLIHTE
jgi:phage-related tail fiber protein